MKYKQITRNRLILLQKTFFLRKKLFRVFFNLPYLLILSLIYIFFPEKNSPELSFLLEFKENEKKNYSFPENHFFSSHSPKTTVAQLHEILRGIPEISTAHIWSPHHLKIFVELGLHSPSIALGNNNYISTSGTCFTSLHIQLASPLPELENNFTCTSLEKNLAKQLTSINTMILENKLVPVKYEFDDIDGFKVHLSKNRLCLLGHEDISAKIKRLSKIAFSYNENIIVDLRYDSKAFVKQQNEG
jgi:hypothetical protein